ncbi:MAG: heavy metal translocating P-type ATPase [Prevotellaceae bacterium]|nr:heavy metal translocating P-type ATPase [Prevotellaceae bacterium]
MHDYWRILLSAVLLAAGLVLDGVHVALFANGVFRFCWYLVALLPVGLPVFKEVWESIRERDAFNEFTLMTIAMMGAFYIGEYPEGVAVMLFYSLGELFQDKAVDKAMRNIGALIDVRPETATVVHEKHDGQSGEGLVRLTVNPRHVKVGEMIEVKVGERVPLDGVLTDDVAAFNTSALTGESVPRDIWNGQEVLAGMIATDKVVRLKVTKPFDKSMLARILELVENASERKAPAEQFIRKFARVYTPSVTGLAVLIVLVPFIYSLCNGAFTFVFNDWLYRALVFLVISCPCALVVSIPLSYFGGIGAASRRGILFKGGNYLDAITRIDTVVFDKTGTLTQGSFSVASCHAVNGNGVVESMREKQGADKALSKVERLLVQRIASAEQDSTHPIATAIVTYAMERGVKLLPTTGTKEIPGFGMETEAGGCRLLVGNARLLERFGVAYPKEELAEIVGTVVVCAVDGRYAGYLLLADSLKPDAKQAVERLKELNINNIQILSGDKQAIVTTFAKRIGVNEAYGDLLPHDKVAHIEALRKEGARKVAFVGDGINDAPVLALSHVGIAMGGLGSDAAIETADVVIQTDQPSRVATAIHAGKQTRRIVWQNISLTFGVKLLVLILGAGGLATLWEAVFADVGVALIAILNAMRIQRLIK